MSGLILPDLRFEQSFMKSLYGYAGRKSSNSEGLSIDNLTDDEIRLINKDIDKREQQELERKNLQPIEPITPTIVIYAIVKDQLIMPLIQGFLWTGFLISIRPALYFIAKQGQRCGVWIYNLLGINRLKGLNRRSI